MNINKNINNYSRELKKEDLIEYKVDAEELTDEEVDEMLKVQEEISNEEINKKWQEIMKEFGL